MPWRYIIIGVVVLVVGVAFIGWLTSSDGPDVSALFAPKLGPEAQKAQVVADQVKDRLQAGNILDRAVASPVACGDAARAAFDPMTGNSRYWFYRWPNSTIECYATGGYHRVTGEALQQITKTEVGAILGDPVKYPPSSTLFTPPPPAPPVTELPELQGRPCCRR